MRRAAGFLPWAAFLLLAAASWNRWMEPFVDTGRELMVPRRIAQGERLYRDVHFHHGPLAPWIGALCERIAPRSFAARTILALAVAAAAVEALRRLARRSIPGPGADVAAALAVALPFFLRPGGWPCPFSVDTALAAAALFGVLATTAKGGPPAGRGRDLLLAALVAIALLSRLELGLAGAAAAALDLRRTPRRLALAVGAPLAAAGLAYAAVSAGIPFETLVADGWLALLRPPEAFRNVYRSFAGLDRPLLRLGELALAAILVVLAACVLAAGAAVAERLRSKGAGASRAAELAALAVLAAAALVFAFPPAAWAGSLALFPPIVRVVPPLCLLAAFDRIRALFLRRPGTDAAAGLSDGAILLAAAFSMRSLLAAGYVGPYNAFFLPLPILVAAAVVLRASERWSRALGSSLPRLATGALVILLAFHVISTAAAYRSDGWERLDTAAGAVVLPAVEARTARPALADLARHMPPGSSLTGFPEAGFFEYVLGTSSPLPLEQFWPGHLDAAGEERMVRLLTQHPPRAVLEINALAVGEGARAFGHDYSKRLAGHVRTAFRPVAVYGPNARLDAEIGDPDFFVRIRVPAAGARP